MSKSQQRRPASSASTARSPSAPALATGMSPQAGGSNAMAQEQLAAQTPAIEAAYTVRTPAEMQLYMQQHIERVVEISKWLVKEYPDKFGMVDVSALQKFAGIHDQVKIRGDQGFLEEHDLVRPVADDLLEVWGKDLRQFPEIYERMISGTVNRVDEGLEQAFLEELGIPESLRETYLEIVHLADQADRGMNPLVREEMNKDVKRGSVFAKDNKDILEHIEEEYHNIFPYDVVEGYLEARDNLVSLDANMKPITPKSYDPQLP